MLWIFILVAMVYIVHYPEYRSMKRTGFSVGRNFLEYLINKIFRK